MTVCWLVAGCVNPSWSVKFVPYLDWFNHVSTAAIAMRGRQARRTTSPVSGITVKHLPREELIKRWSLRMLGDRNQFST